MIEILTMERCPDGVRGECFYRKEKPKGIASVLRLRYAVLSGGCKNNSRTAPTLGPIGYWRHLMDCLALGVPEKNGGERRASVKRLLSVPET